jgi:hypothetical protein
MFTHKVLLRGFVPVPGFGRFLFNNLTGQHSSSSLLIENEKSFALFQNKKSKQMEYFVKAP